MAVRYADSPRPQYRKREAFETRFAQTADASLSVSGTGDAAPSTGIYRNRNGHGHGHGHGNRNDNRNDNRIGRCAGNTTVEALATTTTRTTAATVAQFVRGKMPRLQKRLRLPRHGRRTLPRQSDRIVYRDQIRIRSDR